MKQTLENKAIYIPYNHGLRSTCQHPCSYLGNPIFRPGACGVIRGGHQERLSLDRQGMEALQEGGHRCDAQRPGRASIPCTVAGLPQNSSNSIRVHSIPCVCGACRQCLTSHEDTRHVQMYRPHRCTVCLLRAIVPSHPLRCWLGGVRWTRDAGRRWLQP